MIFSRKLIVGLALESVFQVGQVLNYKLYDNTPMQYTAILNGCKNDQ